ncbi:hypothetical protein STH12_02412 [Shewanella khirikhana]|uniref:Uncharacterized protein n=1 Tax=Shewanella khirikhana TaxID=1965282 RepID=A0ABM7DP95_9GAMM|nr:hypothetical protein STH12_02412 [Shewanella khirikhana]
MPEYIIDDTRNDEGYHEIHNLTLGCKYMPLPERQVYLGMQPTCKEASLSALRRWRKIKINGCEHCCRSCYHKAADPATTKVLCHLS